MKNFRLLFFLLLSVVAVPLTSCGDDDDDDFVEPSRRELLSDKAWKGTALYAESQDITQVMADSIGLDIRQLTMKFNTNGTYTSEYKNMPDDNGKWEFANNEQDIIFDKGTADENMVRIGRLTSTELYLNQTLNMEDENGNPVELDVEWRMGH